jgi:hypothetical protein
VFIWLLAQLVPLVKQADPSGLPSGFLIDEKTIYNRMQSLIRSAAISDPRIMGYDSMLALCCFAFVFAWLFTEPSCQGCTRKLCDAAYGRREVAAGLRRILRGFQMLL